MDIQPLDIAIHIVNILVLYILLRVLLYKPVQKFMQARADGIEAELQQAKDMHAEADSIKAAYDARMDMAENTAQQLTLDATKKAGDSANAILDAAKRQADDIVLDAVQKAEKEREESVAALQHQIADLSLALAGDILQREVNKEDNSQVIRTFFEKVG